MNYPCPHHVTRYCGICEGKENMENLEISGMEEVVGTITMNIDTANFRLNIFKKAKGRIDTSKIEKSVLFYTGEWQDLIKEKEKQNKRVQKVFNQAFRPKKTK